MNATWQIVDKLIAEGYDVAVFSTTGMPRHKGRWGCAVVRGDRGAKAHADTAPLAICRAVLAMLGGKEQL